MACCLFRDNLNFFSFFFEPSSLDKIAAKLQILTFKHSFVSGNSLILRDVMFPLKQLEMHESLLHTVVTDALLVLKHHPDSKVPGANMGPIWWAPCWPHELCYLGMPSEPTMLIRYSLYWTSLIPNITFVVNIIRKWNYILKKWPCNFRVKVTL